MAETIETKDKVVTVESLKVLHDYDKDTYVSKSDIIPVENGGTGSSNGATGLETLFAGGKTILSSYQYGDTLPKTGTVGKVFFKRREGATSVAASALPAYARSALPVYAMQYSDGLVFQINDKPDDTRMYITNYTNFEDMTAPPWNGFQQNFTSVHFNTKVAPLSMASWFSNSCNLVANISNFTNLDMNNVVNMFQTFHNCTSLTGSPMCGEKAKDMYAAYRNCYNLTGNAYFYSPSVSNMQSCFSGRNTSNRLNIYVPTGSATNTTIHHSNASSLVGTNITWANGEGCQYNTQYNIYIYPVTNVTEAKIANGD